METRDGLILVHKKTGLFFGKMKDLTPKLWDARRFINQEQLDVWFEVSPHAPDASEFTIETVDLTIERRPNHEREHGGL